MKTPNLAAGVAVFVVGASWLVQSVIAASNPTPYLCMLTQDACQSVARELALEDFVDGFIGYTICTAISLIILFMGRTSPEQVIYNKVKEHPEEYTAPEDPRAPGPSSRLSAEMIAALLDCSSKIAQNVVKKLESEAQSFSPLAVKKS